jgi:transcriptional regulator with XRE-family HTH domain
MEGVRRTPMIGQELRAIREQRGISARLIAAEAGISRSALTAIERGERYPSLETLEALASCLRINIVIGPTETVIEPLP